ncbi:MULTISPECIES: hypothetical protein [Halorussus]|uniref:hypothetical protein n=1 Tax=Halorussus TaxID=1070314 RepID=UPI000E218077|nr:MULTISPECIES: hypothetical protein [Halorussus]NHN60926.1 hypothetical protein [Halorussus sp. JP-T4]
MPDRIELGVSTPALGIAVVGLGIVGLEIGGQTSQSLDGTVPVALALTGGALVAVASGAAGFWLGSARTGPDDD